MPKGIKGFVKGNKEAKKRGPKRIEKEIAKEEYIKAALKIWQPLFSAQKDLALGHYQIVKVDKKKIKGYWVKPDKDAIENILSRVIGKPKEEMELIKKLLILDE